MMRFSIRQKLGAFLLDLPRYIYLALISKLLGRNYLLRFKNRRDDISIVREHEGVACHWQWTSDLHLPRVIPLAGQHLFRSCMHYAPIRLDNSGKAISNEPKLSFVIGHRGEDRLPLLLATIDSIGAQSNCNVECIVVEQSATPTISAALPHWVRFYHQKVAQDQAYSRSMAFNYGALQARSEHLILHDNDLIIPECYAIEHLNWHTKGYDFVNLKRFIFYISEAATVRFLQQGKTQNLQVDSIMQNAQGGGSIGASKKAYFDIGGFDERFLGWGGEDNEFWQRAQTRKTWSHANLPLIHLWHSPQEEKVETNSSANKELYNELSSLTPKARITALKRHHLNKNPKQTL